MSAFKDHTGQKIGKLLITGRADNNERGGVRWFVNCDCGQEGIVMTAKRIAEGVPHCGCEFTGKNKKMSDAWKRRLEAATRAPIITAPQRVINDYLYKYRVADEAHQ